MQKGYNSISKPAAFLNSGKDSTRLQTSKEINCELGGKSRYFIDCIRTDKFLTEYLGFNCTKRLVFSLSSLT